MSSQSKEESRLQQIRAEEQVYHDQCYAEHVLFEPGSWLYKPVKTVLDLLPKLRNHENVRMLDLGCGVGRNTIPMAEFVMNHCASGRVIGVDLLASATEGLSAYSEQYGVAKLMRAVTSEIEAYSIEEEGYDFIVAVSALEHVRSPDVLRSKLFEIADGVKPEGIVCLVMSTNIQECMISTGEALDPKFEVNLQTEELQVLLTEAFGGWEVIDSHAKQLSYLIERQTQPVRLSSDCPTFSARKSVYP
ncbi:class I SAM-dependent methyltransferase [Paenibacillus nanensis]|uniref:class I SAM-dependent methyltransferase n=1 Tax=Paenibacillus nanensis TaxID=393251 RepID=UPI0013C3699C|nr:class I SAM-dependent methyltransferase [Paenibacillus nanensis]